MTMRDFMRALHLRFTNPSRRVQELEREIDILHKQLAACLEKPERKMLLRLTDLEDELQNQVSLDGFMSGFRLAEGIHREVSDQPPYSFDQEEDRRTCEVLEGKEE